MYYSTLSYRVSLVKAPMFDYVISDRSPQKSDFCTILYLRYYMFLKLLLSPILQTSPHVTLPLNVCSIASSISTSRAAITNSFCSYINISE